MLATGAAMTDAEILKLLATLGVDDLSFKALPLLPLVHVAWADGSIQGEERELIADTARTKWTLGPEAQRVLDNWLAYPPSETYLKRGRSALVALALRDGDMELQDEVLSDVAQLAKQVAKAAGGLFGLGAVSHQEAAALGELATALKIKDGTAWQEAVTRELKSEPPRQRVLIKFNTDTLDLGQMPGVLVSPSDPDTQIPVEGTMTIGYAETCDVVVDDPRVSPVHAELRAVKGRFYVKDLSPPERGVRVDGERIVERRLLGGEALRFGDTVVDFKLLRRVPDQML